MRFPSRPPPKKKMQGMREHLVESKGGVLKRRPSLRESLLSASGRAGASGGGGRRLSRERSFSGRSLLSSFAGSEVGGGGGARLSSLGVEVRGAARFFFFVNLRVLRFAFFVFGGFVVLCLRRQCAHLKCCAFLPTTQWQLRFCVLRILTGQFRFYSSMRRFCAPREL